MNQIVLIILISYYAVLVFDVTKSYIKIEQDYLFENTCITNKIKNLILFVILYACLVITIPRRFLLGFYTKYGEHGKIIK